MVSNVSKSLLWIHCRGELDEDVPGRGKFYCTSCSRYFVSERAQADHERTKMHKKRVKELQGPRPHSQSDADWAGGLGPADNGVGTPML